MGQSTQEWTKKNLWKTAFKKFEGIPYSKDLQEREISKFLEIFTELLRMLSKIFSIFFSYLKANYNPLLNYHMTKAMKKQNKLIARNLAWKY